MPRKGKGKSKSKGKSPAKRKDDGTTELAALAAPAAPAAPGAGAAVHAENNYVPASQPGCLVAHHNADWIIGSRPFDFEEFDLEPGDDVPDLSVDPEELVLSAMNPTDITRSYFITVGHPIRTNSERTSTTRECWTLVAVLAPRTIMDLCQIVLDDCTEEGGNDEDGGGGELRISSDIKDLGIPCHHSVPGAAGAAGAADAAGSGGAAPPVDVANVTPTRSYPFPLRGGPFLCSQGFGGSFTHFYPGTQHAVDFECAVGTDVLAIGPGLILETRDDNTDTGIDVANLFRWNSVMLQLDDGAYVEYVHIRHASCKVKEGDRVVAGQVLCESGDVGFCPTPHLHLQMHGSGAKDSPTIPFALNGPPGAPSYIPIAGEWYPKQTL